MCIIAAKYLQNIGWVLSKNRDQDYVSNITFKDEPNPTVGEIFTLVDHNIGYREGMNHIDIAIITTSLTPIPELETNKRDGDIIYEALKLKTPEDAAKYVVERLLTGFIFIASKDKLILVEAARKNQGKGEYQSVTKEIPKSEIVVRTNHGVELSWAGFQKGVSPTQDMWRESSELRKAQTEKAVKEANTPVGMLDAMSKKMNDNLQLNQFRVETKPKDMRTIFQWVLVPSEKRVYVRPIQCKMKMRVDVTPEKVHIKLVDNGVIKKTYETVKHFCRVTPISNNGKELKSIQKEGYIPFKKYIGVV